MSGTDNHIREHYRNYKLSEPQECDICGEMTEPLAGNPGL